MTLPEILAAMKLLRFLSGPASRLFNPKWPEGLGIHFSDYGDRGPGGPRVIDAKFMGPAASEWVASGVEVLRPKRCCRRRGRYLVAFCDQDPPEWKERLEYKGGLGGCGFQLHDDAPRDFDARIHIRGRYGTGRERYRDFPCETIDYQIDWNRGAMRRSGHS